MSAFTNRPNLDLLRAVAVTCVVVSHLRDFLGWPPWADAVYNLDTLGLLGVMIFFVHTTLVLMLSMERSGASALPFIVRRVFRIYPLAVTVVLLCAIPRLLHGTLDVGQLASNLLLVQNLTGHASWPQPLWTLPYEMQMYLLLPAVYFITTRRLAIVWIVLLCAVPGMLAILPWTRSIILLNFVPCFLPGAIAFCFSRLMRETLGPVALFVFVLGSIVVLPMMVAYGSPQVPLFWAYCLCLGLLIPHCAQVSSTIPMSIGKTIATYSYGIYLTHPLALWLGFSMPGPVIGKLVTSMTVLAALSWVAYHGIERPGINLGVRLAAWMKSPSRRERTAVSHTSW